MVKRTSAIVIVIRNAGTFCELDEKNSLTLVMHERQSAGRLQACQAISLFLKINSVQRQNHSDPPKPFPSTEPLGSRIHDFLMQCVWRRGMGSSICERGIKTWCIHF